jgi:hypothetical protein
MRRARACLRASSMCALAGGDRHGSSLWTSASEPATAGTMFLRIQDKAVPCQWMKPVMGGLADYGFGPGLGIVCTDQGKDGPVASGYGENARCRIRHPVSLNVRVSALWEIIWRKGGHKSSVRTVLSGDARCRITRCQYNPQGIQSARRSARMYANCGRTH